MNAQLPQRRSKEDRLVAAATALFSRYGVRATSMEQIARDAGVAKATAYAYFRDKDDVFRAVCENVARDIVAKAQQAAEDAAALDEDPEAPLAAALASKYRRIFELVYASPHAAEILASTDQVATAALKAAEDDFERLLAAPLRSLLSPREARRHAALLIAAAEGISRKVKSAAQVDAEIQKLVRLIFAGLRATCPAPRSKKSKPAHRGQNSRRPTRL
jgi:TetR/AcrR family transcriptional regulator